MILRVFRAAAPPNRRADVVHALGTTFLGWARELTGIATYVSGLRDDPDACRFVVASTWPEYRELERETGGRLDRPIRQLPDWIGDIEVEHYELLGTPEPIHVTRAGAVIRIIRAVLVAGREEEFYDLVRRREQELEIGGDLLAFHLGRRMEARQAVIGLGVWRDREAIQRLAGPDLDRPLFGAALEPLIEDPAAEHFETVPTGDA